MESGSSLNLTNGTIKPGFSSYIQKQNKRAYRFPAGNPMDFNTRYITCNMKTMNTRTGNKQRITAILFLSFYCTIVCAQIEANTVLTKVPFKLVNNHIYLHLQINNSKPLWFILDTGAPTIIDRKQADKLNLKLHSLQKAAGVGNETQDASLTSNVSFKLNHITHIEKEVAVVALDSIEKCGHKLSVDTRGNVLDDGKIKKRKSQYLPFDGVLGANFFKSFVIEINYKQQHILLHNPKTYRNNGRGTMVPLDISANQIFTNAIIHVTDSTDIEGYFMIDTGSMLAIVFNTAFIRRHNLMPPPSEITPLSLCGLGGNSKAQKGILRKLTIREKSLTQLPAIFSQATSGVLSSTEFDGHIGNAVLRHFNVIFDYSNKRMILE